MTACVPAGEGAQAKMSTSERAFWSTKILPDSAMVASVCYIYCLGIEHVVVAQLAQGACPITSMVVNNNPYRMCCVRGLAMGQAKITAMDSPWHRQKVVNVPLVCLIVSIETDEAEWRGKSMC